MSEHVLTDTTFEAFDLHPLLQQGLADCGFTRCTPIQALTLPLALAGRDVAGQAQTGTGKTCAFLVALMNRLLTHSAAADHKDADPRALIIAPTRELAIQIDKDARAIGARTGLKTALIYGGVDYDKQRQALKDGCDIIIATPGRLLDYYKQHVFGLNSVEVMVIDEADRMFDLGFIKDVRFIFRRLPAREQRQVLLYSATLSHRVLELAYEHMHEAEKLVVETDNITADRVRQVVYFPAKEEKVPLLLNLLQQMQPTRSLIFINTKAAVERVTERLKRQGYRVGALSGDVPQLKRQKLLQRFKDSQLDMLVCTDVAARGLHIPAVSHVFNYDLPQDAEDYVHRVGRTARLGAEGDAISFACDLYAMSLPDIESYIEMKIPTATVDPSMLVMPKPHAVDAQFAADAAADSEAFGDKVAPREGDAKRGGKGPRSRSRAAGGAAGEPRKPRRPQSATHATPAATASATAEVAGAATGAPGTEQSASSTTHASNAARADGAPRKRRRRGGRNRKRGAGDAVDAASGQPPAHATAVASDTPRADKPRTDKPRAPRRARPGADNASPRPVSPSAQVPATRQKPVVAATPVATKAKKPGLFRRLASGLFGSN